jgi:hypothetical protein
MSTFIPLVFDDVRAAVDRVYRCSADGVPEFVEVGFVHLVRWQLQRLTLRCVELDQMFPVST